MEADTNIGRVVTLGIFNSKLAGYIFDIRWAFFLLISLVAIDLWWGTKVSKKKGQVIRASLAWRRTLNKIVDYTTYIIVAAGLANAIFTPIGYTNSMVDGVLIGVGFSILCEMDSVTKHIFYLNGITFSWKVLLISLIKLKSPDFGDALSNAVEQKKEQNET